MNRKEISMRNLIGICVLLILSILSCSDDERSTSFINNIADPTDLALEVSVSTDNSGLVTLAPSGTSVASFVIEFGDGSGASDTIVPGETVTHIYAEGTYSIELTAMNSLGVATTFTKELVVNFIPPTNLSFTVEISPSNLFEIEVTPIADNASGYEIYFGDVVDEMPILINIGDSVVHEYAMEGSYNVRVVAFNGGMSMIEAIQSVTIESPDRVLPLDFEK